MAIRGAQNVPGGGMTPSNPLGTVIAPPPGAQTAEFTPVFGIPDGGRAVGPSLDWGGGVSPKELGMEGRGYTEKDLAAILASLPAEQLARVQRQMKQAGLIGPETAFTVGMPDGTTQRAFGELFSVANLRGVTWEAALTQFVEVGGPNEPGGVEDERRKRAAEQRRQTLLSFDTSVNTYQRSDPANLRLTVEQAFRETLGRKPTAAEQQRFVGSFLDRERSMQSEMFATTDRLAGDERARALEGLDENAADFPGMSNAASDAPGDADPVGSLLRAIGTQESGNDYGARNGRTGASGKYQIMPSNWGPWSKEAGLGGAARTPENQEKVARFKMGQYVKEFGQQGAAVAWYAGPGAAKAWLQNSESNRFNRKQGKGNEPSINEYVQQVTARMDRRPKAQAARAGGGGKSESDVLWEKLQQLIADAPGKVTPGKRSRSYEEQVELYRKYKNGTGALAAKPGTSKHGDGRANDLKYDSQATKRWVLENAGKYGLAFPLLKAGEDWHIELADGHYQNDGHDHGGSSGAGATGVAPVSINMTDQARDAGAQATEWARNSNPTETKAYDIGGQFTSLVNILSKGVM